MCNDFKWLQAAATAANILQATILQTHHGRHERARRHKQSTSTALTQGWKILCGAWYSTRLSGSWWPTRSTPGMCQSLIHRPCNRRTPKKETYWIKLLKYLTAVWENHLFLGSWMKMCAEKEQFSKYQCRPTDLCWQFPPQLSEAAVHLLSQMFIQNSFP